MSMLVYECVFVRVRARLCVSLNMYYVVYVCAVMLIDYSFIYFLTYLLTFLLTYLLTYLLTHLLIYFN